MILVTKLLSGIIQYTYSSCYLFKVHLDIGSVAHILYLDAINVWFNVAETQHKPSQYWLLYLHSFLY